MERKGIWLVAVSAGPDSMALLDMCLKKKIPVAAAHVNYHHQKQAEEEEKYIRAYCRKYHLPLFVRNEPFLSEKNFEADARAWRYDFFVKVVKENGYEGVFTAHQEDDLLETYLMQRERELVPSWYGIREEIIYQGVKVVRPLLSFTKEDLRIYCDENHIRYYIDETNADRSITRNRIRQDMVEKMSRPERDRLFIEINKKNREKERIEEAAAELYENKHIRLEKYRDAGEAVRWCALRKLLDGDGKHVSLKSLQEKDEIIRRHRDFMIPFYNAFIVTDGMKLFLYKEKEDYADRYDSLDDIRPALHYGYEIREGSPSVYAVTVNEDDFPIVIRNFHAGDAIEMQFGTKHAGRFFVDRKIPLFMRKSWPVVVNRKGEIILIPGLGCSKAHYSPKPSFNVLQYTQIEELQENVGRKRY